LTIRHNTIDGNLGDGISLAAAAAIISADIFFNLITNHNQSGKYGINCSTGTVRGNDILVCQQHGYNWYYNNTLDTNNLTLATTDKTGTDPQYTDRTNGDLTPGANTKNWINWTYKGSSSPIRYEVPGAVQLKVNPIGKSARSFSITPGVLIG